MLSFGVLASKVFGSSNDRKLKKYASAVAAINALEPEVVALSDEELRARTDDFPRAGQGGRERSTICSPRPLPRSARRRSAPSASATSTCS